MSTQPSFAAVDPQPGPGSSLADFFDRDERIALIFRDKCWSRADLAAGAERFASGLLRAGVQVGDRVILHLTEGADIALLYLACFRIGAIACPIYSHYQTLELERMFRRLGPALYVGHAELYPKVQALDNCILPAQSRLIIGATDGTSARSWSSLLGSVAGAYPPDVDLHAAAVLLATSGTTGEPKLVAHSQASLAAYARKMAYREFYAGQIIAYSLELAHMPGIGHLLASLYHGATLVVVDRNDPEAILDAIENQQCTYLTGVPGRLRRLINIQRAHPRNVSSLRFCIALADVCPPATARAFEDVFGVRLHSTWSSTEAAGSMTYGWGYGNVSRAVPGVDIQLVDMNGDAVVQGEVGEMLLRGDNITLGYWTGPGAWSGLEDGWYRSGDLMRKDETGQFQFVGRVKDIIIVDGDNVSPAEVEAALMNHPSVWDAGVAGLPDPTSGEHVVAVVQLAGEKSEGVLDGILRVVSLKLAAFKVPKKILHVAEIPRTAAGKIDRRRVAAFFERTVD